MGGRAVLLLPGGVYRNNSKAAQALRKKLCTENQVHAVVSLPQEIFLPTTRVSTSLVFFTKGGSTEDVWFYRVFRDGFSCDAQRKAQPARTDLWDARCQFAAIFGLEPPVQVRCLQTPAWWERYLSDGPNTVHVTPVLGNQPPAQNLRNAATCIDGLSGFMTGQEVDEERSWFVTLEEIIAQGYSLCADTYRLKSNQSQVRDRRSATRKHRPG